ncbi:MAG: methyltransferase [Dehalococcoidales bacterium]|nr:methyltransferase [Dehalococcoidales bacterium]
MIYIAIGCLGFLLLHIFDIVSWKKLAGLKPFIWFSGSGLLVYAMVMAWLRSDEMALPLWTVRIGWALLAVSCLLLIYSLFINLPFRKTYIAAGVSDRLVTTGLYAMVRHPGVHWFTLAMFSLVLVSRSRLLLIAAPIFILMDIALTIWQDKFLFGRMFEEYDKYRRETPMLIPNRRSLNAFVNSLKQQFRA